jgi:hypothetical protein
MTMFAIGLRKDQMVNQVMEFAHVRYLPMYEAKNILFDRLNVTVMLMKHLGILLRQAGNKLKQWYETKQNLVTS